MKLNRILTEYSHLHENYYVNIKNKEGVVRIPLEDLLYIEVVSHNIVFHKSDEEITIRGVLKWNQIADFQRQEKRIPRGTK